MRFGSRIAVAMAGLVLLTAAGAGWLGYRSLRKAAVPLELRRLDANARQLAAQLSAECRHVRRALVGFQASPALEGLVRAIRAGGVDPATGLNAEAWMTALSRRFAAELEANPTYDQFRLLGPAPDGKEIVRVDRVGGSVRTVPEPDLQAKGKRYYYVSAVKLASGGVYVSPIDLNEEEGKIETPHKSVVRVAMPVDGGDGSRFGVLVINVDLRNVFDDLRGAVEEPAALYVVNEDGDFLVHPQVAREYGFQLGTRYRLQDEFPGWAVQPAGEEPVPARVMSDGRGAAVGVGTVWADLGAGRRVGVVLAVPEAQMLTSAQAVFRSSLVVGLAAVVVAVAAAIWVAFSVSRPLVRMTEAVGAFSGEETVSVPMEAPGEIGQLARAFERMTIDVREKTAALQREVETRRRAEEAAERNAAGVRLLGAIVESSNAAIVGMDLAGKVSSWNNGAQRLFGYSADEMIGASVLRIVPDDRQLEESDILSRIGSGERVEHFETVRRTRDGSLIDVELIVSPVRDADGRTIGASKISRDVSQRKLAEERFRVAFEAAPSGMVMVDGNGKIVLVNVEAQRMFGYTRDELVGRSVEVLVPERFRSSHPGLRSGFSARPEKRPMGHGRELYGQRKDGSEFRIEIGLNPIETRQGALVLSVIVDITERLAAEAALREGERRLQAVMENLTEGLVISDLSGRSVHWNRTALLMHGLPVTEERRGVATDLRELFELSLPDGRVLEFEEWPMPRIFRGESVREFEACILLRRTGETRVFSYSGTIVRNIDRQPVAFVTITDQTERSETRRALERQTEELKRSNAELEQFAYVASHDLQEPLRMVASYTELLGERYRGKLDEKADKFIHYAVDGARRMQRLVDDLLTYSRVGRKVRPFEWVDLDGVVAEVLRSMEAKSRAIGAQLTCAELPKVWGDQGLLMQVFQNLISNALKFVGERPSEIRVSAVAENGFWRIDIADNGIGIDPSQAGRLFQMFQRLHERGKYEGSGIGLAIVKKIIQYHGGRIWFDSEPGRGTTFRFTLPQKPGQTTT